MKRTRRARNKYRPYVRRANGREKADTARVALRLTFYQLRGRPYYVMVQRGFPNLAIEAGRSKHELKRTPFQVAFGRMKFRAWAKMIEAKARGFH